MSGYANAAEGKRKMAEAFRTLADTLEHDDIEIIDVSMTMRSFPECWSLPGDGYNRYTDNGQRAVELMITWYDPELDKLALERGEACKDWPPHLREIAESS